MGFKTVQKVLGIGGISSTQKHVLTILALHVDDKTEECFPSVVMLQEETNLSKPAVLRAISALQEAGFLTVEKKWKKNFYKLHFSTETEYFDGNSQVTEGYRSGNAGLPDKCDSQVTESYHSGNGALPHQVNESYLNGNGALPDKRIVNRTIKKNSHLTVKGEAREALKKKDGRKIERKKSKSAFDVSVLTSQGVDEKLASDFVTLRKAKNAPITETAVKRIESEAGRAGISLSDALAFCCANGYQGFKAEWFAGKEGVKPMTPEPWWTTWPGIESMGHELGLKQEEGESCPDFKTRVFRAAGHVPQEAERIA